MKFNYQARTKAGEVQTGTVEAPSKQAAISFLQKYGLFVSFLEEAESKPFYARKITLFGRIPQKDIVAFSRQLSLMFQSKIPLIQALQVLANQTKNASLREKILTIAEDVKGGTPFSQALSRYPKIFSAFYVSMVKSGEASGTLSESLDYLAEHLEREYHLHARVQGAMIYPALILVVVIGVLLMMMYFVIPNLARVLTETGQELPLLTRVVIGSSDFLRKWGWLVFLGLIGAAILVSRYFRTKEGKKLKDKTLLRLPLVGPFLKMIFLSRFAENLSTLISGGLPIAEALEITGNVVGNDVYQSILAQIRDEVQKGVAISKVLSRYPEQFPPVFTQLAVVGEKTGTLDKSLMYIVTFYQKEIDRNIDNLLNILEPIMIIFLGAIVAGIMGAVLMPLYKMTSI